MNITIVGGGFGGVRTALQLAKNPINRITLISDKDYFQYYPSLYSTATGRSHLESWIPLGTIFSDKDNVRVMIDKIVDFNPNSKQVTGESGMVYGYDRLVLALGSVTTYFGIQGLDHVAFGIKSKNEIKALKRHLYHDIVDLKAIDRNIVIIGGGPTGVELASAITGYIDRLHKRHKIRRRAYQVHLVEASPRLLPRMHETTSRKVQERLEDLGVHVRVNTKVEAASAESLTLNGKSLESGTIVWTSGVAVNPFYKDHAAYFTFAPNGKIEVNKYLQAAKQVYVLGDNANTPFAGLAQTALHDANFVAKNLRRVSRNKPQKAYHPMQPPVVIPIGERWAAFEFHWFRLYGWPAGILRRFADLIGYSDILGVRRALSVWQWSGSYQDDYFTPQPIEPEKSSK